MTRNLGLTGLSRRTALIKCILPHSKNKPNPHRLISKERKIILLTIFTSTNKLSLEIYKFSNLQYQPQVTATKYLSMYWNKKFENVLKLFEISLYLSQVRTQAFIWSFMYSSIFQCWFHNEFIHFLTSKLW